MNKNESTALMLDAKRARRLTWANLAAALGLGPDVAASLAEFDNKGEPAPSISREPRQYRFQEIIYVYGTTIKAIIEEKFGAGIMSAIDFTMSIDRVADPKGDRVQIVMNGKFLGYKTW